MFWLVLPIGEGEADAEAPVLVEPPPAIAVPAHPSTQPGPTDLDGTLVLLVDDDMRNLYSLSSALRERRLAVVTATEGQEALDALASNASVDAVLMDVMMPGMDGYETVRRIRANEAHRALPVIALTARAVAEERDRCLAAGATECLAKPVDIDQLLATLARLVTRRGANRAAPGS